MKNTDRLPYIWRWNVNKLRSNGLNAVLAGGALRDLYCAKRVKDIDIFILYDKPTSSYYEAIKILRGEWLSKTYTQISPVYEINYVAEQTKIKPPIQLIGVHSVKTPLDLISRFDFGLNQICYDGNEIIYTKAFERDFMYGNFTLTHPKTYDKSIERFNSWNEKYPNWPYKAVGKVVLHEFYKSYGVKVPA